LELLERLESQGHARPDEVIRARTDVEISEAQVLTAEEDLVVKRCEYERILAQLDRRVIRAPVDGVISVQYKQVGEYVAPNSAEVFTLVQLDQLLATFSVPDSWSPHLTVGEEIPVFVGESDQPTVGIVDTISPIIDAESATVRVKVRLDNRDGQLRSGERCRMTFKPPTRTTPNTLDKTVQRTKNNRAQ
jgi:RND family efflux transporter MFP subunit